MPDENETMKQLLELRYITQKTGALHPLQMKNLQMWGYLTFPHVAPEKIQTFFHFDKRTVTYAVNASVEGKTRKAKTQAKEQWQRLTYWVQALLGDEYSISIEQKGRVLFQGRRQVPVPKRAPEPKFKEPADG